MDMIWNWFSDLGTRFYTAFIAADRWKLYLSGLENTLTITLGAICISTVLGMILCLMKISRYKLLRGPAKLYIDVIRGVPVVVQLMIIYFVVLATWTNKTAVGIIAFAINSAAYTAEIFRSGINAVDPGQMEAGRSLGLSHWQTMWHIIFPQAIKNCLPTYTSEFIALIKETSVASFIAVTDLTKAGDMIRNATYNPWVPLFTVALIYLVMTLGLEKIFSRLERRLAKSDRG